MKHLLFTLILFFSSTAFSDTPPIKFKNPIFNGEIEGLTRGNELLLLSPTSYDDLNNNEHEKCILLADNDTDIVLECDDPVLKDWSTIRHYVSRGYDPKYAGGVCMIRQYSYADRDGYHKGEWTSRSGFAATPLPDNFCGPSISQDEFEESLKNKSKK
jgi:hypothetical protein